MEAKIVDGLSNIGYTGSLSLEPNLRICIEEGVKNVEYTKLVSHLCDQLRQLCHVDEQVNVISSPDDSSAFVMEITSFLKELNCPYRSLTSGHASDRLQRMDDKQLLLDFLVNAIMTNRMMLRREPVKKNGIELKLRESTETFNLKQILVALGSPELPPAVTVETLFRKTVPAIETAVKRAGNDLVGKPFFTDSPSDKQWEDLDGIQRNLHEEYRIRRELLLTRLDVTIQSFEWSDRTKGMKDEIQTTFWNKKGLLICEPNVNMSDLLSARTDVAIIEKTSNSSARKNTMSSFQKIVIGKVPDRGGRTNELVPPPPEMPSWQQRAAHGPSSSSVCNRGNFNRNIAGNERKNLNAAHSQKRSHIADDEAGRNSYGRSEIAIDSAGTYETNKKVKSYDDFYRNSNNESYSEQYARDSRRNERYHRSRGGRFDNRRGRGRGGRNTYYT